MYMVLQAYLHILYPDMAITDRNEDVIASKNILSITHSLIPNNKYTQATVLLNQDIDNKELFNFLNAAELTKSRLVPRPQIVQSRMDADGNEIQYLATYLVKFDVLEDAIVGLEQEDGTYVTPHSLTININITKIKEELL